MHFFIVMQLSSIYRRSHELLNGSAGTSGLSVGVA